jgi:excinuclease ABC subunit C
LVSRIADVEVILVNNETESLILENNLIKRHKPAYNRHLISDDSGYTYIALTAEAIPRFVKYRKNRVNKDLEGRPDTAVERRFGPYVNRRFRDVLLEFVCDAHQLRVCKLMPRRACLSFHLGKCSGICEGEITADEYAASVNRAIAFLSRDQTELIQAMKARMQDCAERLEFERAQRIKEQVQALERVLEKQIVERDIKHDQDVIYFGEQKALVARLQNGVFQGLTLHDLDLERTHAEACAHFLLSQYERSSPHELIVSRLHNRAEIEHTLTIANQHRVRITEPRRGIKHDLLKLCERNYAYRVADAR